MACRVRTAPADSRHHPSQSGGTKFFGGRGASTPSRVSAALLAEAAGAGAFVNSEALEDLLCRVAWVGSASPDLEWPDLAAEVEPTLTDLSRRYSGRVKIVTIDVDAEPELARTYRVQGIPALFLLEKGAIAESWVGVQPPRILETALQARL